jgi:hypothetical protein
MKNAPAVPSAGDALIHWRGAVQIPPPERDRMGDLRLHVPLIGPVRLHAGIHRAPPTPLTGTDPDGCLSVATDEALRPSQICNNAPATSRDVIGQPAHAEGSA